MFKQVETITSCEAVIKQIQSLIYDGSLKKGERLPSERQLSIDFNVGRTTVREAMKALESAGLITITRRGMFVNRNPSITQQLKATLILDRSEYLELVEARKVLETELAARAAIHAHEDDIVVMKSYLAQMVAQSHNLPKYLDANIAFHMAIAKAANNKVLYNMFVPISDMLKSSHLEALAVPNCMAESMAFHHKILDAICKRNPEMARIIMGQHLEHTERNLIIRFKEKANLSFITMTS